MDFVGFRQSGLARPNGVIRRQETAPQNGGSRGYSIDYRRAVLEFPIPVPISVQRSVRRWRNDIEPKKMTGNKRAHKKSMGAICRC